MISTKTRIRVGDIEFRYSETNKKFEIVRWNKTLVEDKEYCFTIAYINDIKNYDVRCVCNRVFELDDAEYMDLRRIMCFVYDIIKESDND